MGRTLLFVLLLAVPLGAAVVHAQPLPPPYLLQWGSSGTGNSQFNNPHSIAADPSGALYVTDNGNNRIQKFTAAGAYTSQWSTSPGSGPRGIAYVSSSNALFVVTPNSAGNNIKLFNAAGMLLSSFGPFGVSPGSLNNPTGIAATSSSVLIVDTGNNRVQRFTTAGVLQQVIGGPGTAPGQFSNPQGIAVDGSGFAYVADFGNDRIQKFDPGGSFVAQWSAFPGGTLDGPSGIAIDAVGDLYVTDSNNDRVIKFSNTGANLVQWGSSGSGDGQFTLARGVLVDGPGDVYVVDESVRRIQKFAGSRLSLSVTPPTSSFGQGVNLALTATVTPSSATGTVRFLIGGVTVTSAAVVSGQAVGSASIPPPAPPGTTTYTAEYDGDVALGSSRSNPDSHIRGAAATALSLVASPVPSGAGQSVVLEAHLQAVPSGSVSASGSIQFTVDGVAFGTPVATVSGVASTVAPALAVGATATYGASFPGNSSFLASSAVSGGVAIASRVPFTYLSKWGSVGSGPTQFTLPQCAAVDASDDVYVTDSGNNRLLKFSRTGSFLRQWGGAGTGIGQLLAPRGVAVSPQGVAYVTDGGNHRVTRFSSSGAPPIAWGGSGAGPGQFSGPRGIGLDSQGNVYVSDTGNNRVQKFTSAGVFVDEWGGAGSSRGLFAAPHGLAVDGNDNVYVVDQGNSRIQKFASDGTYLAQWSIPGSDADHVSADALGNIFLTFPGQNLIAQFTSDGTLVASWGSAGTANGRFDSPKSAAPDADGFLYVVDTDNNRIQRLTAAPQIASITDVGGDQGGQVRLRLRSSPMDYPAAVQPVAFYDVFRKIGALLEGGGDAAPSGAIRDPRGVLVDGWDYVGTATAYNDSAYVLIVPTLADSTSGNPATSEFFVRAATATPGVFYDSPSVIGRSVDNLAPGAPAPFVGMPEIDGNNLQWGESESVDLQHYRLHRGTTSNFTPTGSNLIATPVTTSYSDPETEPGTYYYKLAAMDLHENIGPYASATVVREAPLPAVPGTSSATGLALQLLLVGAGAVTLARLRSRSS